MKISYIVLVYKDVEALHVIIDALISQTVLPDEIIIAEDGNSQEMREFCEKLFHKSIKFIHTTQEDLGWRKNRSANQAVRVSSGEYLIFNDGDCVPYPHVVASHIALMEEDTILCGRRVNLGEGFSKRIREKTTTIKEIVSHYLSLFFAMRRDGVEQYEEGIYFRPTSWLYKKLKAKRDKKASLLGCCWGVFKKDLEYINGFDEDYIKPTTGCDTDVQRRMEHFGYKFKSCRNAAIVAHLYHKEKYMQEASIENQALMQSKEGEYICKNGLKKL